MSIVQSGRYWFVLLAATLGCSLLPSAGFAYTAEEQQACQGDAFRLCGDAIPDVDRVTACMVKKQSQLSPGCRVYFRHDPPSKSVTRAASSKSRKSKKAAKPDDT